MSYEKLYILVYINILLVMRMGKIPLGYYDDRISWLTERKHQVSARIYADKLTLKAIDKEIERCKEAMQKTEDYENC